MPFPPIAFYVVTVTIEHSCFNPWVLSVLNVIFLSEVILQLTESKSEWYSLLIWQRASPPLARS